MPQKKAVFLFGAGAVLDWGAPKTICSRDKLTVIPEHGSDEIKNRVCCLTHLITAIGFYNEQGERITDKIFNAWASKVGMTSPNFETIINVSEDLYTYWGTEKSKEPSSLYSIVNLDEQIKDFSFFKYSKHPFGNMYSISIPEFDLLQEDYVSDEIHPNQVYYQKLLNDLLGGIKGHVSKYSYYTAGHNVIFQSANVTINKTFCSWMQTLVDDEYSLRMYTLNYDRMFKVLLQNSGLEIFEGFELNGSAVNYDVRIPPNLPRLISDFSSHVYYNLHGSAYWEMEENNSNMLPGYQYFLSPFGDIEGRAATIQIEKGRELLLTNIITGYQKVQRTAISPFRQMLSAFDRDCFEAIDFIS